MKKKNSNLNRILSFARQCRGQMVASVLLAVLAVASGMIPYLAVANLVIQYVENSYSTESILVWGMMVFLGYTGKIILNGISTMLSHQSAYEIIKTIRTNLIKKLSRMPLGDVTGVSSGALKNVIVDTVERMEQPLAHIIPELIANLLIPLTVLAYLFVLDIRIALLSVITIPLGLFFYQLLMKKYGLYYGKKVAADNHMNATIVEYINGIEAIKTFNQAGESYQKYTDAVNGYRVAAVNLFKNTLTLYSMVMYIMPATLLFVLPAGLIFYMQGSLNFPDFITAIILSLGLVGPLIQAMHHTDGIAALGTILNEVDTILEAEEIHRPEKIIKLSDESIDFKEVCFSYDQTEILHGISFQAQPGKMTAIVGPSGSGKSTVARLIANFWDVDSGSISFGGVDMKEIPLTQVNELISYVAQDNFLFNLSIMENIRIGKKEATDEEVMEAAKKASCHEFILNQENGYQTLAGEGGNHFSGGEKQRISIARAILKNSPVIILDEATAFTDPENEALIQKSIHELVKGKTLIVIAHRLSTIITADCIIMMNQGEIVASGTHHQLLKKSELYQKLYTAHQPNMITGGEGNVDNLQKAI